ncbi:hypothetical protein DFQ05_0045 [Winogradskyella wandonensis]|uniref:Uncharacterized protein n=1 Tax=Winogradskyella wandonensis TaxID=1442586 RepID=A0A4R1KV03_9FLAO|nr:hypothetical protein [Winogradskyella wandonensis]TCK68537.1 hypothetical protein DFQ05_0045 [Winogradskyella wandonensis]
MRLLKFLGHLLLTVFMTAITQVGGIIWLLSLVICKKYKFRKRLVFPILYLVFNLFVIPPIAKFTGREKLPYFNEHLKSANWFYPLAFRNYVKPELKILLIETSKRCQLQMQYLDANFPFFDGFPLLPHSSHDDGKKIDLSFKYKDENGKSTEDSPSFSGYGAYANSDENFTASRCKSKGFWQYDFSKYLSLGINHDVEFDSKQTKLLIETLHNGTKTQKIFIEPHLKKSMGLSNYSKIRFHGCKAVRHDDHIHLQIK